MVLRPRASAPRARRTSLEDLSSCRPTRGCVVLSSVRVYGGRWASQLNSRKVTGDAATHRRVCFTHAPSRSIDYFPPMGRKGRGWRVGRITGAGGRGDGKDGREASYFLFSDSIVVSFSFCLFFVYAQTRSVSFRAFWDFFFVQFSLVRVYFSWICYHCRKCNWIKCGELFYDLSITNAHIAVQSVYYL